MTDWSLVARQTIQRVTAGLPDDMSLKARKAAIDAAYPFGQRAMWPYKAWLKARREYLNRYGLGGIKPTGLEHLPRDPITGRPVIQ